MARIAFYKGWGDKWYHKITSALVKVWTRGKYTHVELINDDDTECPKGWCWYSASAFNEGLVRVKNITIKEGHWDIYELGNFRQYDAFDFMEGEIGKKYDWPGIFLTQIFRLGRHHKEKWFCSEIVRMALCKGDLFICKNTGATNRRACDDVCQKQHNCDKKSALCDGQHHKFDPNKLYRELKEAGLLHG